MSSNKTNKPASTKSNEVVKQEDVVVAVLVADSFNVRFAPVTETTPKVILLFRIVLKKTCIELKLIFKFRHSFLWSIDP